MQFSVSLPSEFHFLLALTGHQQSNRCIYSGSFCLYMSVHLPHEIGDSDCVVLQGFLEYHLPQNIHNDPDPLSHHSHSHPIQTHHNVCNILHSFLLALVEGLRQLNIPLQLNTVNYANIVVLGADIVVG